MVKKVFCEFFFPSKNPDLRKSSASSTLKKMVKKIVFLNINNLLHFHVSHIFEDVLLLSLTFEKDQWQFKLENKNMTNSYILTVMW